MEKFPSEKGPSAEELLRAQQANEAADPTTYSALPPEGAMHPLGTVRSREEGKYVNPVVESDGEVWYRLEEGSEPRKQQLAARLLKGIVNVADVVERDGEYWSKRLPHELIHERISTEETEADLELLNLILDDSDHFTVVTESGHPGHNARLEDETSSYFDFSESSFKPWSMNGLRRRRLKKAALERLDRKLSELAGRFDSPEGKTFARDIYESTGGTMAAETAFEDFYTTLVTRIHRAQTEIRTHLATEAA